MSPETYERARAALRRLTRDVTQEECAWLDKPIVAGQTVFVFNGLTYGCISHTGQAVSLEYNCHPFFELPADALALLREDDGKKSAILAWLEAIAQDEAFIEQRAILLSLDAHIIAEGGEDDGIANAEDLVRGFLAVLLERAKEQKP